MVRRTDTGPEPVSLLRLDELHPGDEIQLQVDPQLSGKWTFAQANVGSGQRIQVKTWNLWEKEYANTPIDLGKMPNGDIVPLFFLILNPNHENKVLPAVRQALETSSQQIVTQTAAFETIYQQQNRLLNFMTAYAELGPKQVEDPTVLKYRIAEINADLGIVYDPNLPQTQPGSLQRGLDAGYGFLDTMRESPDNPGAAAAMIQQQLPTVVSDWVSLVGDLMRIFIKPPHQVKLLFIPASAGEADPAFLKTQPPGDDWLQFVTQRVLDTSGGALPAMVFRANYVQYPTNKPVPFQFERNQVMATNVDVAVPMAAACKDLFLNPWAWDWEYSDDNKTFSPLDGAHLVPGRGLVFPITESWWKGGKQRSVFVRAHVGFHSEPSFEVKAARVFPQTWAEDPKTPPDMAVNDGSAAVTLTRSGIDESFYRFAAVTLVDSAGHSIPGDGVTYDGTLKVHFNLAGAAPGIANIKVQQEEAPQPDPPAQVLVIPKRPAIDLYCGQGDHVLRVAGPDAGWVKQVTIPALQVRTVDESQPGNRQFMLSGPLPNTVHSVEVKYHDPEHNIEWTRTVNVNFGLARPQVVATLFGTVPSTVSVGAGTDPSWAVATLPPGWFSSKEPVRVQLSAIAPFSWSHDITLDMGLGSASDVQQVATLPEGPSFALDKDSADAYTTLTMDTAVPANAKRNSGLLWFKLTRGDLASQWIVATLKQDSGGMPLRAVKLPTIQLVETLPNGGTRITLGNADQVLGVKFTGQVTSISPTLVDSTPTNLVATVDGPPGATDFDIELRDATDGVVHFKIVKTQKAPK